MTTTPDQQRAALRRIMDAKNWRVKRWADLANVKPNTLYNFLNGHSQALKYETMSALADAANVPVQMLTGQMVQVKAPAMAPVIGKVQAGVWQEALQWPEDEWQSIAAPVPERYQDKCFAFLVEGPSMNQVYPSGSYVLCVRLHDFRDLRSGDRVVVQRVDDHGHVEATCKELVLAEDGSRWLMPKSTDPRFQAPIELTNGETVGVEIIAAVIGSYRPESI